MSENGESETPYSTTIWRVNALYSERSGWFQVHRAYVWAKTEEDAMEAASRVFIGAKHIALKKRVS